MRQLKPKTENCQVCGEKLTYIDYNQEQACMRCGKLERANILCSNGHYICNECHGMDAFDIVKAFVLTTGLKSPLEIAETLMSNQDKVPMLGCENAWIAGGALMASLKNEGTLKVSNEQIEEALQRTKRQAIGGYCGLTGVCGIAPALGACFSVLLGAACPKDQETATTMRVVSKIVQVIADQTGPCCCKNFVRTALAEGVRLAHQYLGVKLSAGPPLTNCTYVQRHPHGCRKEKCRYFSPQ